MVVVELRAIAHDRLRERTTIRPLRLDDAAELAGLYAGNREFLRPFEPDRDARFFTPDGQRTRAELAIEQARKGTLFRYVIADPKRRSPASSGSRT